MVDGAAVAAREAPTQAGYPLLARHADICHRADSLALLGQGPIQGSSLLQGAGEAVQDTAPTAVILVQPLQEHADGYIVGDELAPVHVLFGPQSQLRPAAYPLPEHVAGRDMAQAQLLGKEGGLGPFASPWCPQGHYVQRLPQAGRAIPLRGSPGPGGPGMTSRAIPLRG